MKALLILVATLAGCASGVTQLDKGTYMASKTSAGGGLVNASGPKAEVYTEANAFCAAKGLQLETVTLDAKDGRMFVNAASAELTFKCVSATKQ